LNLAKLTTQPINMYLSNSIRDSPWLFHNEILSTGLEYEFVNNFK